MAELDLATLANYAEILGFFALVGGLAFGIIQIRHLGRKRKEAATIEMMHGLQNPDFLAALPRVLALSDDLTTQSAAALPLEDRQAIMKVAAFTETLGLLVHRRLLDFVVLEEFLGLNIVEIWRRIRPFAEHRRSVSGGSNAYGWTQWLAERLEAVGDRRLKSGPQELYRDWRP